MRGMSAKSALIVAPLLLAGCQPSEPSGDDASRAAAPDTLDDVAASNAPDDAPDDTIVKKSIIRAEVDTGPAEAPPLEPAQITVPFPARGDPDAAGLALVDGLIAGPAFKAGGPITIWGHSDSRGSDADNLAASRRRAEALRAYLEGKGIARGRITVIPLGESRPVAPNRKLDGSDDPEGRAKNRRVDIRVDLPSDRPTPSADRRTARPE